MPKSDALKTKQFTRLLGSIAYGFATSYAAVATNWLGEKFGTSWHICMQLTLSTKPKTHWPLWISGLCFLLLPILCAVIRSMFINFGQKHRSKLIVNVITLFPQCTIHPASLHPPVFLFTTEIIDIFYGAFWQSTCQRWENMRSEWSCSRKIWLLLHFYSLNTIDSNATEFRSTPMDEKLCELP